MRNTSYILQVMTCIRYLTRLKTEWNPSANQTEWNITCIFKGIISYFYATDASFPVVSIHQPVEYTNNIPHLHLPLEMQHLWYTM